MLKTPHYLSAHLEALDYGRKPDIGTPKKEKEDILSECWTEIPKEKFLQYVNGVLFEMLKTVLEDT